MNCSYIVGGFTYSSVAKDRVSLMHQEDLFVESLTVEEHLYMAVALRATDLEGGSGK